MARNKYPEETVNLIIGVSLKLFMEKGYENTSIQDIIDHLGGLSKGAIYHHFKSKEDILNAVGEQVGSENARMLSLIRDDSSLNGYQKLRKIFQTAVTNTNQEKIFAAAPNLMKNSRFLVMQIEEIFKIVVPDYVQPILEEGRADGSIKTDYPKELGEVILLLMNIWMNPLVIETDAESMLRKLHFLDTMLRGMGLELLNEEMFAAFLRYCEFYKVNN